MTIAQLRKAHGAEPFQPFVIHLADGRRLAVPHPERMAIFPTGRTIAVAKRDGSMEMVDLLQVTSLELRANGSRKSKTVR